jgi:signal transduction histidine kinase
MSVLLLALLLQGGVGPVQMGAVVRPETVTVGDHFVVAVRVRAPRGATIEFPAAVDSSADVDAVDSRVLLPGTDSSVVETTATYRLAAWDTGTVPIPLGDVVVARDGAERRISLGALRVQVRSVLPPDTAQHVPKPARDILAAVRPWWHWLLAGLIALALIGLLIWWWRRRRRRPKVLAIDAYAQAEQEFAHIEKLGLLDAGERGRYVALHVEVMRDYLAARLPLASRSHTSTELLDALRHQRLAPLDRLATLLAEADLIKFARRPVATERAREMAKTARSVVHDVEAAHRAELAREREKEKAA